MIAHRRHDDGGGGESDSGETIVRLSVGNWVALGSMLITLLTSIFGSVLTIKSDIAELKTQQQVANTKLQNVEVRLAKNENDIDDMKN